MIEGIKSPHKGPDQFKIEIPHADRAIIEDDV